MAEKKVWDQPLSERQSWIEADASVPLSTQCKLVKVTRSVIYEQKKRLQKGTDKDELVLLRLLDEEYTRHPFYGSRFMARAA